MPRWYPRSPVVTWYEIEQLPSLGWLTITWVGNENIYFTMNGGRRGYCKVG